jgi:hypothetical protein
MLAHNERTSFSSSARNARSRDPGGGETFTPCGPITSEGGGLEGGLMDEQEVSLTDEEWGRFDEIWQRFIKGPDAQKIGSDASLILLAN